MYLSDLYEEVMPNSPKVNTFIVTASKPSITDTIFNLKHNSAFYIQCYNVFDGFWSQFFVPCLEKIPTIKVHRPSPSVWEMF